MELNSNRLLEGKTILITGASRGIGRKIAERFAEAGARLVLTARNVNTLEELMHSEIFSSGNHLAFSMDVTREEEIKAVFSKLATDKILLDGLVNNAGIMVDATLQMVKPEMVHAIMETNVQGTIFTSQYSIKSFIRNKGGSIINLSSIIGTHGNLGQTIYSASKSAVIGFTKSLSKELAPLNIRVNALAPGFIDTDMIKNMDQKFFEKNLASIGMRRLGKPEDVANVALFLASDLSSYVTGQIIGVDGGMVI